MTHGENKSLTALLREETCFADALPHERFLRFGAETLTDAELLAILLRTGTRSCTPTDIGYRILAQNKGGVTGLNVLHRLSLAELKRIDGIGGVKAVQLKCVAEIAGRMHAASRCRGICFSTSSAVASYYMERLRHEARECVFLMLLDTKCRLIDDMLLSTGLVDRSMVSPRDIFLHALNVQAVYVVLVHNHPSGDPTPSRQDLDITERIRSAGEMLDIRLYDHIIIGDNTYYSLRDQCGI